MQNNLLVSRKCGRSPGGVCSEAQAVNDSSGIRRGAVHYRMPGGAGLAQELAEEQDVGRQRTPTRHHSCLPKKWQAQGGKPGAGILLSSRQLQSPGPWLCSIFPVCALHRKNTAAVATQ
jgi:hypothetical protein